MRSPRAAGAVAALVAAAVASCSGGETAVRLTVLYEDAWALDELDVEAAGRTARVEAAHEVLVLVSDEAAGEDLAIDVDGLRGGTRIAFGRVVVQPILGSEVSATVALTRRACGAWCAEGASACEGDGVVSCQRDEDDCMRWRPLSACASATPFCSLGVCGSTCVDECADGEQRCAGPEGVEQCGQADSDPCRDWLTVTACAEGEQCESGRCASACAGECEEGAVQCRDGGLSRCADRDFDGCPEWGPSEPCPAGESCEGGACLPIDSCTDGCSADACDGTSLTRCGNYDLDPCLEPSPGTSCVPSDPCMDGSCTLSGCQNAPRVCSAPPPSFCVDSNTLRVYESTGTCTAGTCDYPSRDEVCPNCPACDVCAGMTCDSPPAPSCLNATTLRTYASTGTCTGGTCSYPPTDTPCPAGCDGGRCVTACTPGAWTTTTVVSYGGLVQTPCISLALDNAGAVHMSYCDKTDRIWMGADSLRYAHRSTAGIWTTEIVDESSPFTGHFTSIAVDSSAGVHIGYHDQWYGNLRYAHRSAGGTWTTSTVDSGGDRGEHTSLALDGAGGVHISYFDRDAFDLRYAYRNTTGAWTRSVVDSVESTGMGTSLALDALGSVHISYYDYTNHDLRYALRRPDGTWTRTTVDSSGLTGSDNSLAVDAAGGVHISYHDSRDGDLRYAYRTPAGAWSTVLVDPTGDTGEDTSLALDAAGGVHISYLDYTNRDLRYAYRSSAGSWTLDTVDSDGHTGHFSALALDASGGVHIAYQDVTTGTLRYATGRVCP